MVASLLFITILSCNTKPRTILKGRLKVETYSIENDKINDFNIDKGSHQPKIYTILVSYAAIECTCAQWRYEKDPIEHLFLDQGDIKIIDADTLYHGDNIPLQVLVTGNFYKKMAYPKGYYPEKGNPKPARVFRYTKIKVINQ